jgi:hypothetical protein
MTPASTIALLAIVERPAKPGNRLMGWNDKEYSGENVEFVGIAA